MDLDPQAYLLMHLEVVYGIEQTLRLFVHVYIAATALRLCIDAVRAWRAKRAPQSITINSTPVINVDRV